MWIASSHGDLYQTIGINNLQWEGNLKTLTGSENVSDPECIFYDPAGLLWIGTEGGGVVKLDLDPVNFRSFPSASFSKKSIYTKSLYGDDDGNIWMGTFKNWIYLFNIYTERIESLPLPRNKYIKALSGVVYAINKDKEGIYWIGYNNILIAYNKKANQFFFHPVPLNDGLSLTSINQIRVTKNGLLIATVSGLYKVYTTDHGSQAKFQWIYPGAVSESIETTDGSLWISSQYQGLIKLSATGKVIKHVAPGIGIRCIVEDTAKKIIWAATQVGLMAYHERTARVQFYKESNGLNNTYLYGIINMSDQIWVSTNRGIAKGKVVYKEGKIFPDIFFKSYTKEAGLQSDEFNTGAYCTLADGTIAFGGINGINWFSPKHVSLNSHKPSVSLTALKINDKDYNGDPSVEYLQRVNASYKENTFLIKYAGMEFHDPEAVRYRFMLQGLDKNWTEEKSAREVRYANLPPGNYTFRIFAVNTDGVVSDEKKLAIVIIPPFYKRPWFIAMCVFVLAVLLIMVTKYISQVKLKNRIRILEKEKAINEERQRISKEMHDDLGAGLTRISLISEAARRRAKKGALPQKELNDIADTSKQLIENVSEIIWAMNPDFDSLSGMIAYLREQISKLLEYSNKVFKLEIDDSFEDLPLSNVKRKNIMMLVKESVNNAIKHSNASEICVKMKLVDEYLFISVCDNGHGFDIMRANGGNGLRNYHYRAALLNGTATLKTSDLGTLVDFKIPVK